MPPLVCKANFSSKLEFWLDMSFPGRLYFRIKSGGFMKALFLSILVLLSGVFAHGNEGADLRLYRVVHWKPVGAPDAKFEVFKGREFRQAIPANIYAIDTYWWHDNGPRMETLFMHQIRIEGGQRLIAQLDFQKNDFPMDANWDVLWTRHMVFELDRPYEFRSRIVDMEYRITIMLYKEKL
jgi:hypothetical protein